MSNDITATSSSSVRPGLVRTVVTRGVAGLLVMAAVLFGTAGTVAYWQGWTYLGIIVGLMSVALTYLIRNSPGLLERRMRTREKEQAQRKVLGLSYLPLLGAFVLPGFDRRWGWSGVPPAVVIAAEVLVVLGYGFVILVFRANRYASRVVEVEQGQQVTSTGPYALVRHPMYLGMTLMYLATPLALGSYWALVPAAAIVPTLVARIFNEEKVLERDLSGYREYRARVRYRLVPGIW
jgi:protein-S-isoprenylcysteine O-methyltransferase Ste14